MEHFTYSRYTNTNTLVAVSNLQLLICNFYMIIMKMCSNQNIVGEYCCKVCGVKMH